MTEIIDGVSYTTVPLHQQISGYIHDHPNGYLGALKTVRNCGRMFNGYSRSKCYSPICGKCNNGYSEYMSHLDMTSFRKRLLNFTKVPRASNTAGHYWVANIFEGIREDQIFAFTINLEIHGFDQDLGKIQKKLKKKFRKYCNKVFDGHLYYAWLEHTVLPVSKFNDGYVDDLAWKKEKDKWDGWLCLTHAHGLIHVPGMSKEEIEGLLRAKYPAGNQVRVTALTKPSVRPGKRVGGVFGWTDYMSMGFHKNSVPEKINKARSAEKKDKLYYEYPECVLKYDADNLEYLRRRSLELCTKPRSQNCSEPQDYKVTSIETFNNINFAIDGRIGNAFNDNQSAFDLDIYGNVIYDLDVLKLRASASEPIIASCQFSGSLALTYEDCEFELSKYPLGPTIHSLPIEYGSSSIGSTNGLALGLIDKTCIEKLIHKTSDVIEDLSCHANDNITHVSSYASKSALSETVCIPKAYEASCTLYKLTHDYKCYVVNGSNDYVIAHVNWCLKSGLVRCRFALYNWSLKKSQNTAAHDGSKVMVCTGLLSEIRIRAP